MRRSRRIALLVLAAGVAACSGMAHPGTPGGPPLQYDLPDPNPAVYTFADTSEFAIRAGAMGVMNVVSAHSGVAEVTFRRAAGGVDATVRLSSYSGRFENPNQAGTSADEDDITGAWEVSLGPRGGIQVVSDPAMTARGREVVGGESLIRPLFANLPGQAVGPGATWVDTVSVTEEVGGTVSRARSVVTSVLAGDTVVAGERLLLIRTSSDTEIEVTGTSGGIEIREGMIGRLDGFVLWDAARALLVERRESGEMSGTLELPGMGAAGLPVQATVRRSVSLRP